MHFDVTRTWVSAISLLLFSVAVRAEITRHGGSNEPVQDNKYVHVVSESDSPVMQTWIKAKDGVYIAAAVRKPKGNGPFPAIIMFHGAPGGRGMDQLVGWSRGDHGGPVWERFLQEGPFNDILNWNYHRLPDLLGGGWGFEVNTVGDLHQSMRAALANRDAFSVINVRYM